jgi:aminopeptidase YwaD
MTHRLCSTAKITKPLARAKRPSSAITALVLLVCFSFSAWSFDLPAQSSRSETLKKHISYLASSELTGRGVDTPGIKLARDYIAREFASYGLAPGGDDGTYLQSFELTTGVAIKEPTALALESDKPLRPDEDWTPLGISASGKVEGELVFASYGITVKDFDYDDYKGIDAKGKIVIVLRYEPPPKDDKSPFRKAPQYSNYATLRAKVDNARDHGAAGLILVDLQPLRAGGRELISIRNSYARGDNSVVAAQVKRQFIEPWLKTQGVSLAELAARIDANQAPASKALPRLRATLTVTLEPTRMRAENVVAVLPGSDANLKSEAIVVGAHYDHLGYGHFGTRDSSTEGQIHYGADDNASGTAALLQVAEFLAHADPKPARSIVFAAFSGEELGLLGSRHYVNFPAVRLSSTKAMLNMDMVGRLRDNRLTVFGTRAARELSPIVLEEARRRGLEITESDSVGRSDHMSFYNKKIPALHFFTGSHPDYHRPGDTWDKINFDGLAKVGELVAAVVERTATLRQGLDFVSLPSRPPTNESAVSRGYGVYLGTIPDFADSSDGVKLAGVTDGSPAALAGMREGDLIVQFAGTRVLGLEDLAMLLNGRKPGEVVEIIVTRGGTPITLKATLQSRS